MGDEMVLFGTKSVNPGRMRIKEFVFAVIIFA
jgi:hypothetical protein